MQRVKGPTVAQVKAPHGLGDKVCGQQSSIVVLVLHKHRGGARMGLDIIDLVTQPLQPDHMLHGQPDNAGYRHLAHHAQHDNFFS